jgi:hypothetical protein
MVALPTSEILNLAISWSTISFDISGSSISSNYLIKKLKVYLKTKRRGFGIGNTFINQKVRPNIG